MLTLPALLGLAWTAAVTTTATTVVATATTAGKFNLSRKNKRVRLGGLFCGCRVNY